MRNELFKCEITRADRLVTCFIVAPEERRAGEILFQNEIKINRESQGFVLERVDEVLPLSQRKGLDTLLESGCVGPASYNKVMTAIAWFE